MRTKNSFLNFLANTGSHFLNVILSFVCRTVFMYTLSKEYLGVSGLFTDLLAVLSLAELGIGGAIIYHMYQPVADKNYQEQRELMNLYRRMYTVVALVIAVLGLAVTPFLDVLTKGKSELDVHQLTIIYLLYLFNTVSSYFFCYKRSIIDAHQKAYIGTIYNTVFTMIQFVVQIAILLLTHNFIAYLLVQIVCNIATNIVVAHKADKMYPYLREDTKSLPEPKKKKSIYKNISAMFMHRVGDVMVNGTDNLIMSAFVGVIPVGIYSNYMLLQASINTALNGVFGAFTASIGDLGTTKDDESIFRVYKTLNFLGFWLYGFSTIAFLVMFNPFIEVWAGEDMIFPMSMVLLIVVNFYIAGMRKVTLTFRDAMGLYWYDRYKPIFEVIINLSTSLILVQRIGIEGVLLGTTISTMTTCWWIEPYVTYKHGFHKSVSHFFRSYALYTFTTILVGGFTYWVCDHFTMGGVVEIILKLITCIVVYNVIILLLYGRTQEFKELWKQAVKLMQGYLERRRKAKEEQC